jgi:hypothetical protein
VEVIPETGKYLEMRDQLESAGNKSPKLYQESVRIDFDQHFNCENSTGASLFRDRCREIGQMHSAECCGAFEDRQQRKWTFVKD